MIFAREPFAAILPDILPLLREHHTEVAWLPGKIPLAVDEDYYTRAEAAGAYVVFTARLEGVLIAYSGWFVGKDPNFATTRTGHMDVIYVVPERRGKGVTQAFLEYCENQLKVLGVKDLVVHIKHSRNWAPLASAMGFLATDTTFHKWLGD